MKRRHDLEEALRDQLRQAGLRVTAPRLLVYSTLREAGGHRSVDDLVAMLAARGERLPRMSVYNVVSDLQAAALIMCADVGPGRALYEAADVWHHHFVCRACGRVQDVPCLKGRKPCLEPPADVGGAIDEAQVIFRGRCEACIEAERRQMTQRLPRRRGSTSPRGRASGTISKRTRVTQGKE